MNVVKIDSESIKIGQFLKYTGVVMTGGESKFFLANNVVKVNEIRVFERGKTLFEGDIIEINGEKTKIEVVK